MTNELNRKIGTLVRQVWEINSYWLGACMGLTALALSFLALGLPGLVGFVCFVVLLVLASLGRFAFIVQRRNVSLQDDLGQERSRSEDLQEILKQQEQDLEIAGLQIRQGLNPELLWLVEILRRSIDDVEATLTYKQLASGIGTSRLPIASLASGEKNLVRATVNFPNSPPLSPGQVLLVHITEEGIEGFGEVVETGSRSAILEFPRMFLPEAVARQLDLVAEIPIANSYAQLTLRADLEPYSLEDLAEVARQLKETYTLLCSLTQRGGEDA